MESPSNKDTKKGREYFLNKLESLSREAEENGQEELASILATTMGAIAGGHENLLSDQCEKFSLRMLAELERADKIDDKKLN